jgi:hypothetical protein
MIKQLEKIFIGGRDVKWFKFTQIDFGTDAFLYEIDKGGGNLHWEVFERKLTPICIDFEKHIYSEVDFKEIYPKSEDFGIWAFCYTNKAKAINKFNELSNLKNYQI